MANENNFKETVNSLFKGMDSFISAKTVVGEAIHVGDTIILPLMDVSFGVGAGNVQVILDRNIDLEAAAEKVITGQCEKSGWSHQDP